ncbi:hypothetical protein PNH38_15535 [Anoxybacillus rupiensis]|uniref:Uncharacterized protein n=1 Tax=Anoxybacteroides rupiense TaxID=311460 RepID=A0ABD5IYH5_9BACL|nr:MULTISPECIES: hypothetical protein [Anoxybacillus]MBB3909247.1 hypothetical protein [Anoxybacillus rupiensis]MBS2771138.1 hypothetical protein [Anoxybacillus rupiensis]MDE8565268.1 hypothetical protein [Anoxybacillus rupiensis]MED5053027.1 hypothetical protein [Anoxybacillus rupiensis]QHC05463.1 hypothetical protein GRQ40_17070 [Anoxybacillus sp. PDR2]
MPSTFEQMKNDIEKGWDIVLWSKSYGWGEAAKLAGCIYLGCATAYLGQQLEELAAKVGPDLLKQALANKGKIFGAGQFEVEAGTAYWSTYYNVWNPFKRRHERVTTDRYVRLYVRMRRKRSSAEYRVHDEQTYQPEHFQYPEYSGGLVYPVTEKGDIIL